MRKLILILLVAGVAGSGCYYDRESELYPSGYCDTASVTWTAAIQPVIRQQCAYVGCHAGSGASAGINLEAYAGVKAIAQNGALLGSVQHSGNYTPMPSQASKLPECTISKIRIWVTAGAPEN